MKNPKNFRPHTFKTLLRQPVHWIAYGFGSGLIHPAPGTWGTLMGILLFYPLAALLGKSALLVVSVLGLV